MVCYFDTHTQTRTHASTASRAPVHEQAPHDGVGGASLALQRAPHRAFEGADKLLDLQGQGLLDPVPPVLEILLDPVCV